MKKRHVVMLPAAGTGTAFAIANRLRANWNETVDITTADINPAHLISSSLIADRHYQVPPSASEDYHAEIRRIIKDNSVDTFIPLLNEDFSAALQLQTSVPGCDFWISDLTSRLALSKREISKWLESLTLPTPREFGPDEIDPERDYFVKPDNGSGSRGARSMRGAELLQTYHPDWIIQEICNGPEITVDSFYDSAADVGRAVARERLETKSGVSTKARVFDNAELSEMAAMIGRASGQRGTICFQVMRSGGQFKITDLNFRPGAGTALSIAAGIDVISAAFACRWDEKYDGFLSHGLPADGVFVTRQYCEFLM